MLSIFRNLQKYSVSPPTLKPSHCLGSYIYLPYIPAFQGYTFLTYLPFRDIPSLHTCLSGIYIPSSYMTAFRGYTFLIYQPFRDITFLYTSLSGIYLSYIPAFQNIPSLHTCLLGLYIPFIPARALNVLYCITTFPGQCHLKSARYHSKMYEQSKPPCKRY